MLEKEAIDLKICLSFFEIMASMEKACNNLKTQGANPIELSRNLDVTTKEAVQLCFQSLHIQQHIKISNSDLESLKQ